jgi:transmembrane 9 superfamily protein 2/4
MFLLLAILSASLAQCFYLPGVAPKDYLRDSPVPLLVNALTAKDSLLPYDYYHPGFSFCTPSKSVSQSESLGSILFGDRLFNSPFKVSCFWVRVLELVLKSTLLFQAPSAYIMMMEIRIFLL